MSHCKNMADTKHSSCGSTYQNVLYSVLTGKKNHRGVAMLAVYDVDKSLILLSHFNSVYNTLTVHIKQINVAICTIFHIHQKSQIMIINFKTALQK